MEKKSLESIVLDTGVFNQLQKDYLQWLLGCVSNVRFEQGEYIFNEGDDANHFYVLREGHVAVEMSAPGKSAMNLQTIGDGELLGWSWLFPPYKWHFDARAVEGVRAVAFDGKCLRKKCEENPEFGYELMKIFSQIMMERLHSTRMQVMDVYGSDT